MFGEWNSHTYKCKVVFTHFLGRPLGRFSPVASAFCKNKDTWYRSKLFVIILLDNPGVGLTSAYFLQHCSFIYLLIRWEPPRKKKTATIYLTLSLPPPFFLFFPYGERLCPSFHKTEWKVHCLRKEMVFKKNDRPFTVIFMCLDYW